LKEPFAKMTLFPAFQRDHIDACQISTKPSQILLFLADPLNTSKSEDNKGGITISTPTHLKISHNTFTELGQCKKR
jgi:hypothetical protein